MVEADANVSLILRRMEVAQQKNAQSIPTTFFTAVGDAHP
jgi:hypothetical protein